MAATLAKNPDYIAYINAKENMLQLPPWQPDPNGFIEVLACKGGKPSYASLTKGAKFYKSLQVKQTDSKEKRQGEKSEQEQEPCEQAEEGENDGEQLQQQDQGPCEQAEEGENDGEQLQQQDQEPCEQAEEGENDGQQAEEKELWVMPLRKKDGKKLQKLQAKRSELYHYDTNGLPILNAATKI
ncbi:hypothetical protein KEM56_003774 [Ascosphaera pollenicola]|nr:hypothetical protein KEM56_003774 [Ascosphaera pollenicola]